MFDKNYLGMVEFQVVLKPKSQPTTTIPTPTPEPEAKPTPEPEPTSKPEPTPKTNQQATTQESVQNVPDWVRNIFIWYGEEKISEDELLSAIKFLVNQGIINL
jgi:outer membrane biosynthesis protein TonB